jgi:hypothetical protein
MIAPSPYLNRIDPPPSAPKRPGIPGPSLITSVGPRLLLLLVLLASAWLGFAQFASPVAVVPASAPASEFSAERAMSELQAIARVSHPMGSQAEADVRAYLVQQIRTLGFTPQVQTTTITQHWPGYNVYWAGTVNNVVVRLKGTANTKAILLDAHYDSVPTGPGATDCGSCVVTLLETMRALAAGPPLKNDVIFVFADGEERHDLGAHAFATEHPWMKDVGLALNFEGMGTGGPAELYDSSPQNGWLTTEFLKGAPAPLTSSFVVNLFQASAATQMGMDLQEYLDQGSAGLDFLYVNIPAMSVYHTMQDNVQSIDARSIQHDGSYALSLVRHFGSMNLSQVPSSPDEVMFNLWPGVVVHYPSNWVVPLAVLVVLLFLSVLALGFRRKHLTFGGLALGMLVFPVILIGTLTLLILLWWALKMMNPNYQVFMISYYGIDLALFGLAAMTIAVMSALFLGLRTRVRLSNLAAGALVWWAVLLLVSSLFLPGGSYLFTLPLLFGALSLGWLFFTREPTSRPWLRAVILSVAAVPGVALLPPMINYLMPLVSYLEGPSGLPLTPVPLVFVALLVGLLFPQLALLAGEPRRRSARLAGPKGHPTLSDARGSSTTRGAGRRLSTRLARWLVPASTLLIGVVLLGTAIGTSGLSAAHPGTDSISYQLNADTGQATWQSNDQRLDDWTRQFFPNDSGQGPFQASAPVVALASPTVTLKSDTLSGDVRTLRVQVASPRHAEDAIVQVEAQGEIVAAAVDGKPFDLCVLTASERHRLQFTYYGLPGNGFALQFSIASAVPVKITVQDYSNGLPALAGMSITPRPASLMPSLNPWLDPTIVVKSYTFTREAWSRLPSS